MKLFEKDYIAILSKTKYGFKNIPLLNYNLLYNILENNQLNLSPVDPMIIFENNQQTITTIDSMVIFENKTETQNEKNPKPLHKTRAYIIIYIHEDGSLYTNINNNVEQISKKQLCAIMQEYDIEWRDQNNMIATDELISRAIKIYQIGLSIKEIYRHGTIHHYSVSYTYTDINNSVKSSHSI